MTQIVLRLYRGEAGQDLLEYAILAGLIGVAGAALLPDIAAQMNEVYASWLSGVDAIWEPLAPGGS